MSQNTLGQLDCGIFKSNVSVEENDEIHDFLLVDTNSWKLKID